MNITGYVVAGAFAAGLAVGGGAGGVAYWLKDKRLEHVKLDVARLELAAETARTRAKAEADAAQLQIDALSSDLAHSRKQRQVEYVHIESEIVRYTSPTVVALRPRAIGLLDAMPGTRALAGADPRGAAGAGPAPASHPEGSASEFALTNYVHQVKHQYFQLQDRHSRLAKAVCKIPHVICE